MGDSYRLEDRWKILGLIAATPILTGVAVALPVYISMVYLLSHTTTYISTLYSLPPLQQIIAALPAGDSLLRLLAGAPWWAWLAWPAAASILVAAAVNSLRGTLRLYRGYINAASLPLMYIYTTSRYEDTPPPFEIPPSLLGVYLNREKARRHREKCLEELNRLGLPEGFLKRCSQWEWYLTHLWGYRWARKREGYVRWIYRGWAYTLSLAAAALVTLRSIPPPPPGSPVDAAISAALSTISHTASTLWAWISSNPWLAPYTGLVTPYIPLIPMLALHVAIAVLSAIAAAAIADRWTLGFTTLSQLPGVEALIPSIMLLASPISPAPVYALAASTAYIAGYRVFKHMFRAMVIATASHLAKKMERENQRKTRR